MKEIELIQSYEKSFPVRDLRKMLGIGKTDSYWILKNRDIQTVTINGKIRILKDSFWNWYSNQTKYHIIGGPEPGEALKADSYSVHDLMELLDISESIAYTLIAKEVFDVFKVDYQMRITKESFEGWYPTQDKYRLAEDRAADSEILAKTYSMPEIGRMLGLHRNTVYSIMKSPKVEIVCVAGQKRVTISSFESWYSSQSRYQKIEASEANNLNTIEPDPEVSSTLLESKRTDLQKETSDLQKDIYRLEDLMTALGISRKAAYRLIQSGDIISVKAGKSYMIPASEYKRYIEGRTENGIDHSEE